MQKNELSIWFDDLENGFRNETIIILNENRNISDFNKNFFVLVPNKNNLRCGNTIIVNRKIYSKYNDSKFFLKSIFKKSIIFIKDKESIKNFLNLLENYDEQNKIDVKYHLLEKKDFSELLKMNKEELVNFLEHTHSSINVFYSNLQMYDYDFIIKSIDNLKNQNILSSSFANYLYKFAYLDFTSNTTRVGREIRKILGIKSKTINNIRTIDITFPRGKPFKGYDLNTDRYLEIKKKIAQKLINLNDKKLNLDKIAEITELPIKEVQKLFNR